MNDKTKKERIKVNKMAVLTADCDKMFCVDKKQIQSFKNVEVNQKSRDKANIAVLKISKKIIVESKPNSNGNT